MIEVVEQHNESKGYSPYKVLSNFDSVSSNLVSAKKSKKANMSCNHELENYYE
jgi:hypothetical protein